MIKERTCEHCGEKTKKALTDLADVGWFAFQVPSHKGKIKCYCPKEDCQRIGKIQINDDAVAYATGHPTQEKKELPQLTKKQQEIIDFWKVRGYDRLGHCLGLNMTLHKKPKYECLGLSLQYLEQFLEEFNKKPVDITGIVSTGVKVV